MRAILIAAAAALVAITGCGGPTNMGLGQNSTGEIGLPSQPAGRAANPKAESFWDIQKLKITPKAEVLASSTEKSPAGDVVVNEVRYESFGPGDKPIEIFAYYAYPASKSGTRLPAIVWVHGGACVASKEAAVEWASRGYAAISMDLPGKGGPQRELSRSEGPDMTDENIFKVAPTPKNSYLYPAVNAVCSTISFISEQKQVDPARIGVLGWSWGGVIALIAEGIDDRVSAACTVYGAGYITDESIWLDGQIAKLPSHEKKLWREHFDPSSYLESLHAKTLFVSATQDIYYPLRSFVKTYKNAQCEKGMSLALNRNHEIDEANSASIQHWFDWALRSGPALPALKVKLERASLTASAAGNKSVTEVALVIADSADFLKAKWAGSELKPEKGVWSAQIPKPDRPYFVTVRDEDGTLVVESVSLPQPDTSGKLARK